MRFWNIEFFFSKIKLRFSQIFPKKMKNGYRLRKKGQRSLRETRSMYGAQKAISSSQLLSRDLPDLNSQQIRRTHTGKNPNSCRQNKLFSLLADIHFWKKILSFFNFKVKFIQFLLSKRCTPFVPMFIPPAWPLYGYRIVDGFCCDIRIEVKQGGWTLIQRGKFFPLVFNILNFFKLSNKIKYRTNCFGCTC